MLPDGSTFTIILMFILCSCSKQEGQTDANSKPSGHMAVERLYTEQDLLAITESESNLDALLTQYPTLYTKIAYGQYQVAHYGKESVAITLFDEEKNFLFGKIYNCTLNSNAFDHLQIGDSLDAVMDLDPDGDYIFLQTGRGSPRVSKHYTLDKSEILITYDETLRIVDISITSTTE